MTPPRSVALLILGGALGGAPWLESRMMLHMFVQLPLLLCGGVLFTMSLHTSTEDRPDWPLARVGGTLLFVTGVVSTWMIPRALDAAVEHLAVDAAKAVTLVLAGFLGFEAWQRASTVVRLFVFGNTIWMTAVAGMLFLDTNERLCTTYGAGEQKQAGIALIAVAILAVLLTLRVIKVSDINTAASHSE